MTQWREQNLVQPFTDKLINYQVLNEDEKVRLGVEVDSWGKYFGIYVVIRCHCSVIRFVAIPLAFPGDYADKTTTTT